MAERALTYEVESGAITATIDDFKRLSGISRSRIYELLKAGKLQSVHIMGRHLIIVDSYREYIRKLHSGRDVG